MKTTGFIQQLSSHLFWDVDAREMDVDLHQGFIITRAMDRGTREDVDLVWSFYGSERVRESLLAAPSLQLKTICFFANQYHLCPEDFRAFHKAGEMGTWTH